MSLSRRRSTAWLAALAMALYALWPLLSQAKPRAAGPVVPVCTVEGITHYIELPAGKSPLEQRSNSHTEHCSFCFSGAERLALPSSDVITVAEQVAFARPTSSSFVSRSWSGAAAQARAPPFLPLVAVNDNQYGRSDEQAFALQRRNGADDAGPRGRFVRLGVLHG